MSTKGSLAYGEGFHLYNECFEDHNVYLQVGGVTMEIPIEVWEVVRKRGATDLRLADKTDEQLMEMAGTTVDAFVKSLFKPYARGSRQEQVEETLSGLKGERERQKVVRDKILRLEEEQR
jgi:hypothetical protein